MNYYTTAETPLGELIIAEEKGQDHSSISQSGRLG